MAKEFDIPNYYTEFDEFLAAGQFDIVVVCSPPFMHDQQVQALIRKGVPVLIEKPASLNIKSARQAKALAEANSVPIRIAHHLRHQSTFNFIKDAVESKKIGTIISASMEWSFKLNETAPSSKWKLDPTLNGLTCLYDAGIHCVDVAVGLFGPGEVVAAVGKQHGDQRTVEDVSFIANHGGIQVRTTCTRVYGPYANDLVINGTSGSIIARDFFTEKSSASVTLKIDGEELIFARETEENAYLLEVVDFVNSIYGGPILNNGTSIDDAISALQIASGVDSILSPNLTFGN
ncbi:putative dehydrogenase [Mycolicibacterium sp. BK556]|nr:putative dehydrogenase [Mycolicibacterium sp. BK556]MBB3636370.1 putative dehydrogenase [Mycolicibacterium sp. BK607]